MEFDSEEYGSVRRAHYHEAMAHGEFKYREILDGLRHYGLPAEFIQTGGMNGAIKCQLKNGQHLLITDAADALSWKRDEQVGWGVGVYSFDGNENGSSELSVGGRV